MKTKVSTLVIALVLYTSAFNQSDNCSGAVNLIVNANCSTQTFSVPSTFTDGGLINASCASNNDREDGWYTIIATTTSTSIQATADRRIVLAAYTNCTSGELACSNAASGSTASIIFNTTIGNTYYIQLHRRSGGTGLNMSGTICAFESPPPPLNDDPCSAIELNVNSNCTYSSYSTTSATATSGLVDPGCANYLGGDIWFKSTIPSTGILGVNTMGDFITNGGMSVYYGDCNSLTLLSCNDSSSPNLGDMPKITISTRPIGSIVYIRFWEYGNDGNGTFKICTSEVNACGNDLTNDYCSNPATLTQGPGSWSSSTSSTYSADKPGNMGTLFCAGTATIENNSWYRFTALNTTETFNFISVSKCLNNKGIQAEVFEVTNDGSSCCTAFTSKSNYYNPGNLTLGIVTASGLTVSHSYILMVDGYAGDQCDFTVSNWTATGILQNIPLSIQLTSFSGISGDGNNQLFWQTKSEKNNDYFKVERSTNGIDFIDIAIVEGNGNTTKTISYSYIDEDKLLGINYYRITDVNYDGIKNKSEIISLEKYTNKKGLISIYPNPTKNILYVDLYNDESEEEDIEILNEIGNLVLTEHVYTHNNETISINVQNLENGFYFIHLKNKLNKNNSLNRFTIR